MLPIQTCFSFSSDDCDSAMHEESSAFVERECSTVILKGVSWMQKVQKLDSITPTPTHPEQRVCEHG